MRRISAAVVTGLGLAAAAILLVTGVLPGLSDAADHLDAPFVRTDGRIDINDVYVFHPGNPQDLSKTVIAVTVDPAAGVLSPTNFHPDALYQIKIDTDNDGKEERSYQIEFDGTGAMQDVTLRCVPASVCGNPGAVLARGTTDLSIPVSGGGMLRADLFDDPFFFDLNAFRNNLMFCPGGVGSDFFLGFNTAAIVLELPTANLGSDPTIGVWATTSLNGEQVERMGRPAINTVFIPTAQKDAFNFGKPMHDQRDFRDEVVGTLMALGNSSGTANALADVLLPDELTVNVSMATGFLNGRNLADDVIDAELGLISGGAITTDCVANDSMFLNAFPYLGAPN